MLPHQDTDRHSLICYREVAHVRQYQKAGYFDLHCAVYVYTPQILMYTVPAITSVVH